MPEIGDEKAEALGNFLNLSFPICQVDVMTSVTHPEIWVYSMKRRQEAICGVKYYTNT